MVFHGGILKIHLLIKAEDFPITHIPHGFVFKGKIMVF